MVALEKAILAIGMFSLAESTLQDRNTGKGGFDVVDDCLNTGDALELKERFADFKDAINVLKHGRGRSYDRLLARSERLSFRVKQRDESFFSEDDVSEITTLVEVNDDFVIGVATVIRDVLAYVARCRSAEAGKANDVQRGVF